MDYSRFRDFLTAAGFGPSVGSINERQYKFLVGEGIAPGQLNEMWFKYLVSEGYGGALSDMMKKFFDAIEAPEDIGWAFSGDEVTSVPLANQWGFSGDTVTKAPS